MEGRRIAVVTGAAGFTGAILVEQLIENGYEVYAIVRPESEHNARLSLLGRSVHMVEMDLKELSNLSEFIPQIGDNDYGILFHLAWTGGKAFEKQYSNVKYTLDAVRATESIGCHRIVCTGSQAEYGVVPPDETIYEDRKLSPFSHYGSAKVAACYLSRTLAMELGVDWIWGRIFSVIGKYEPSGRMLPDLYASLKRGEAFSLSSCKQNWDYLDVYDAADALIALGERGVSGNIYNIANGDYKPLREFTEELHVMVNPGTEIVYGNDPEPFVSLQPSVEKIRMDTGWMAKRGLKDSVRGYLHGFFK
ncbi:MAG: NAD(P)-dependent oxidoreductase [Eubacterium sp.]|nr:NAD(P)-dependent oxidoreductase [Eubacterium sp.]